MRLPADSQRLTASTTPAHRPPRAGASAPPRRLSQGCAGGEPRPAGRRRRSAGCRRRAARTGADRPHPSCARGTSAPRTEALGDLGQSERSPRLELLAWIVASSAGELRNDSLGQFLERAGGQEVELAAHAGSLGSARGNGTPPEPLPGGRGAPPSPGAASGSFGSTASASFSGRSSRLSVCVLMATLAPADCESAGTSKIGS